MELKGILFDMDGVLVDSEEYIFEATKLMLAEHGVSAKKEDALHFVGMGENKYIAGIAKINGFEVDIDRDKARTYQIYKQITNRKLNALPGVIEFLEMCLSKGLKIAVASSADKIKVLINLQEIGLSANSFYAIVTGEDVENKKPFPEIYTKAAKMIGLKPQECLVVEDAVSGIKAGKAAGCKCMALTTSFPSHLLTEADWICENLASYPVDAVNW